MFSSRSHLQKRTPEGGIDREQYIGLLGEEYYTTSSAEAKEQVTANLANFAYDPINYEYLKKHSILNIFLDLLSSSNEKLIEHGLTGVCNFCTDEQIRLVILEESNLELLRLLLQLTNEQIILKILTTFALIITEENKLRILLPDVRDRIQELLALSEEKIYSRIKNYLLILKEFF